MPSKHQAKLILALDNIPVVKPLSTLTLDLKGISSSNGNCHFKGPLPTKHITARVLADAMSCMNNEMKQHGGSTRERLIAKLKARQ
jgi:hypothetical protein